MMLLTKLTLINFQKHRHFEYNFTKGFNTIIGKSDAGKTAIFRALYSLFYNQLAKHHVTTGQRHTEIVLDLSDNEKRISRISLIGDLSKDSLSKYYKVEYYDGREPVIYNKLNRASIQEFQDLQLTNNMSGFDLSFRGHSDTLFLLRGSATEITDIFYKAFNLDGYYKACNDINADLRVHRKEHSELAQEIVGLQDSQKDVLAKLNQAQEEESRFKKLHEEYISYITKYNTLQKYKELKKQLQDKQVELERFSKQQILLKYWNVLVLNSISSKITKVINNYHKQINIWKIYYVLLLEYSKKPIQSKIKELTNLSSMYQLYRVIGCKSIKKVYDKLQYKYSNLVKYLICYKMFVANKIRKILDIKLLRNWYILLGYKVYLVRILSVFKEYEQVLKEAGHKIAHEEGIIVCPYCNREFKL